MATSGGTTIARYRYDGLHRRIRKAEKDGANWDVTDYYYNASWQVLEERFTDDTTEGANPASIAHIQYIWSPRYIDAPVCRLRDTSATPDGVMDEKLFYTTDANMNVTALVDTSGNVVERYQYTPYGKVTVLHGATDADGAVTEWDVDFGGSDVGNGILFAGYRHDPESGLYHVRFRMYHPTLGRWNQRDPLGYSGCLSRYHYVSQRPVLATDYMGLSEYTPPSNDELEMFRWTVDRHYGVTPGRVAA